MIWNFPPQCYTPPTLLRRLLVSSVTALFALGGLVPSALALTPNDVYYGRQWYLPQIGAPEAWDRTTGSPAVVVAVVDTAMDIDHEDLKGNIWTNAGEIFGNGIDDDGNGFIDDVHGWNFLNDTFEVRPNVKGAYSEDGYVHATLVASLIAAKGNNATGIAGVAWNARIMPVVALDAQGSGYTKDVASAIRYAVDNGAHIINLSLEGYEDSEEVDDAIAYAREHNVLTVAAAGNSDSWEGYDLDAFPVYPACLSLDAAYGLIGVGSTDRGDRHASYANFGSCVLVSAPGDDIFGAIVSPDGTGSAYEGGFSGTSLAVPLVSGTAALIKSLRPDWGWAEIRERIMASAEPIDHLQDPDVRGRVGRGRLDLAAAVRDVPIYDPALESAASLGDEGASHESRVTPSMTDSSADGTLELRATTPGTATRVTIGSGATPIVIAPFGDGDARGARASFTDVDGDGVPEIAIVPASGVQAEWALFTPTGEIIARAILSRDMKNGLIVAGSDGGFVVADPHGGRAWGVAGMPDGARKTTLFYPYGTAYHAGLDAVAVPGAVAFSPLGGGGHLMATDWAGRVLVSVFPFGKDARGRWSLARILQGGIPSLLFSGPSGNRYLDLTRLGAQGWQDIGLQTLETITPLRGSSGAPEGPTQALFDVWPRPDSP